MKRPIEVFSVGTDFVQVVSRGSGPRVLSIGAECVSVQDALAVTTFSGLAPDSEYRVSSTSTGGGEHVTTAHTLARPPGRLLARIATVSDTHIGEIGFLHAPRLRSQTDRRCFGDAHPVWALRAAASEIRSWAPDAVVVKGDLSDGDLPAELELGIEILDGIGVPLIAVQGNHDGGNRRACDTVAVGARFDLQFDTSVISHDVRGVSVVMVESVVDGWSRGSVSARLDDALAAIRPDIPTLMFVHHQFMRWPIPTYIPSGIAKREGDEFLTAISRASDRVLISSGHTHRNRVRLFDGMPVTEVGSTKDYPGVWAGYEVYEGGIVQWVRRIADSRTLTWTESTRRAMFGTWGLWAPGRMKDRCFTHHFRPRR